MIVDKQGRSSAYAAVGRSASASSGEFSPDAHDSEHQSSSTLQASTDKKATTDNTASSESKSKGRGFFDTLEWQDANRTAAAAAAAAGSGSEQKKPDRVRQIAASEIASTSFDEEFADFSASRLSSNTNVADVSSTTTESEPTGDRTKAGTATADLLGGSAWNDGEAAKDLFDLGAPEPTNFDLLVGPGTAGNTNGNSSSGFDLLNSDQTFVADFNTCTESSNNPFSVQDTSTADDNAALSDMAADLFGTFDPFTSASADEKSASSSNKPSKPGDQANDFLAYMESKSTARSGKDDGPDLLGGWNAANILSGVSVNMPRASSRPDFGSGSVGIHSDVPRASSSQNMSSKSFGMANGSARSAAAADPFG